MRKAADIQMRIGQRATSGQLCGPQLLWQPSFGEAAVMSGRGPKAVIHR